MADADDKLGGNIGMPAALPGEIQNRGGGGGNPKPDTRNEDEDGGHKEERSREEVDEILGRARKRFDWCVSSEDDNRQAGKDDDQFFMGKQWSEEDQAERRNAHRPCITVNKFPTLVHQVTNDIRMNRPAINVNPEGDVANADVANILSDVIRQIERESMADIAYDTSMESNCRKGWGYVRILTEYERPDSFDQVLLIKRIRNAFTVYMDPSSQEPDGADSQFAFVTEMIPREEFKAEYPWADQINWSLAGAGDTLKNWVDQKQIRVAEYYEVQYEDRELVELANGHVGWRDQIDEKLLTPKNIIRSRKSKEPSIHWYKLTAKDILDDHAVAGRWIPIVREVGDEIDVEGKVYYFGMIRQAKGAQQMFNYWTTKEAEAIALVPNTPYLVAEGQTENYENDWKNSNRRPTMVLTYNPVSFEGQSVPPPTRMEMPQIPPGFVNARKESSDDMMATTGVRFDSTPGERMYDESGRALRELRRAGDIGAFHFVDNHARMLRRVGEILVDLIPRVYTRKRILTTFKEDGSEAMVMLDPSAPAEMSETKHPRTGKAIKVFNPNIGNYGVTVTIGPSYATKRVEAAESMMDFARAIGPQTAGVIADLIAKYEDWPAAKEVAQRLAKTLDPKFLTPEQKDVPPQMAAMMQALQAQLQQMMKEREVMMKVLTDQQADRQQRQDKIDKDFEAKLIGVVQKMEAAYQTHVGSQLKDLAEGVQMLTQSLSARPNETGENHV